MDSQDYENAVKALEASKLLQIGFDLVSQELIGLKGVRSCQDYVRAHFPNAVTDYFVEEFTSPPHLDYTAIYGTKHQMMMNKHIVKVRGKDESKAWEYAARAIMKDKMNL